MSKGFVRRDSKRYLKLGKRSKKKRVWRKAKGRDNKIRLNRFGYPKSPAVGYKSPKGMAGKIEGLTIILVHNVAELDKLTKSDAAIIARVGAKKKLDIIKKAEEMKIKIINLNRSPRTPVPVGSKK